MDWAAIGKRIRRQREFIGYTREQFAEYLDVTPKFCSDIELGVKGMSVPTLCRIAETLKLSTDYILFGTDSSAEPPPLYHMLQQCPEEKRPYMEAMIKNFLLAVEDTRDQFN